MRIRQVNGRFQLGDNLQSDRRAQIQARDGIKIAKANKDQLNPYEHARAQSGALIQFRAILSDPQLYSVYPYEPDTCMRVYVCSDQRSVNRLTEFLLAQRLTTDQFHICSMPSGADQAQSLSLLDHFTRSDLLREVVLLDAYDQIGGAFIESIAEYLRSHGLAVFIADWTGKPSQYDLMSAIEDGTIANWNDLEHLQIPHGYSQLRQSILESLGSNWLTESAILSKLNGEVNPYELSNSLWRMHGADIYATKELGRYIYGAEPI